MGAPDTAFSLVQPQTAWYSTRTRPVSDAVERASVTPKIRRSLAVLVFASCIGLVGVAAATYATWPANTLGAYLHHRRAQQEIIRGLERLIAAQPDLLSREFYQAWLAEEKGDFAEAIRGFESVQARAQPGTLLHLHSSLRLGLAYGLNHDPDAELATYRALMARYPGASLLSQTTFHLRQGHRDQARVLINQALSQDARDGSLGGDRQLALRLWRGLNPAGAQPVP
jgi:tetratricopeptide (TPR) repeat protein